MPSAEASFPGANGKIAFDAVVDGHRQIFVMDPDGGNRTQLTEGNADNFAPARSPDGKRLAFVSNREEGIQSIWIMNANGSDPFRQTYLHWDETVDHSPGSFPPGVTFADDAVDPAWSGDGKWISFARLGDDGRWWIWTTSVDNQYDPITNPETGQIDSLQYVCTNVIPAESCRSATWSPVGARFALVAENSSLDVIKTAQSDGSEIMWIAGCTAGQRQQDPDWSPDGRQMVFSEVIDGNADIYVVDVPEHPADIGGNCSRLNPRQLTDDPATDSAPVWSPDGQQIAFYSDRGGAMRLY